MHSLTSHGCQLVEQLEDCNLWTSKNSVYAFAGTVVFWINDDWELGETVLDLLLLSGNHSGRVSGKLIFKALQRRGIETKLSA
jgi:hypothetical protein